MSNENEIKRKAELFFCEVLLAGLGGTIVPSKGGSQTTGAKVINPPFIVVESVEAEKMMPTEPTWMVQVSLTYVTHIGDTDSPAHSVAVRRLFDELGKIGRGWHEPQQLMVHGIDIAGTDEFRDEEAMSHGDVITVAMGCTG